MPEDARPLSIPACHFQHQSCAFLKHDTRWPHLNIDLVDLPHDDRGYVGAEMLLPGQIGSVFGMLGGNFPQAHPQPALCYRDGITCSSSVEYFVSLGRDVAKCDEEVNVGRSGPIGRGGALTARCATILPVISVS